MSAVSLLSLQFCNLIAFKVLKLKKLQKDFASWSLSKVIRIEGESTSELT